MTDRSSSDWLDLRRQFWEALHAHVPKDSKGETQGGQPTGLTQAWIDVLEVWEKQVVPTVSSSAQQFLGRVMAQGKAYFGLMENVLQAYQTATATAQSTAQEHLNEALDSVKAGFTAASLRDGQASAAERMGLWALPLENWQRFVSSMSVLPGAFLGGVNTLAVTDIPGQLNQFLRAPGVGHLRERQAQLQELARRWLEYSNAAQEYQQCFNEIGAESVERLQQALSERPSLNSLRALYDLWVDCCEAVYADHVQTDHYAEVHGRLINALMAVKQQGRIIVDELAGALNLPTRQEMETLHRRFHQLRRETKVMQAELALLRGQGASQAMAENPKAGRRPAAKKKAVKSRSARTKGRSSGRI